MAVNTTWTDPITCPFCGDELASPGIGFIDHIDDTVECASEFDHWRENVSSDIAGEWSG